MDITGEICRGVVELQYGDRRTELWQIDPCAATDDFIWFGTRGTMPGSPFLEYHERTGTGAMNTLLSLCMGADVCRLWWFTEGGAAKCRYEKSGGPLTERLIYQKNTTCCISPSLSDSIHTVLSSPPFNSLIDYSDHAKDSFFDPKRAICDDEPELRRVQPYTFHDDEYNTYITYTMPAHPDPSYLSWIAFPQRDTSPTCNLVLGLPRRARVVMPGMSMEIPCKGYEGTLNPLPRLCLVTEDKAGPLAGVPFRVIPRKT